MTGSICVQKPSLSWCRGWALHASGCRGPKRGHGNLARAGYHRRWEVDRPSGRRLVLKRSAR